MSDGGCSKYVVGLFDDATLGCLDEVDDLVDDWGWSHLGSYGLESSVVFILLR